MTLDLDLAVPKQPTHNDTYDNRGAIWTRTYVVECILELVGYTEDQPLHTKRALEPTCGEGAFLLPMIERLMRAWKHYGGTTQSAYDDLAEAICAIEIHAETFAQAHKQVKMLLLNHGFATAIVTDLRIYTLFEHCYLLL